MIGFAPNTHPPELVAELNGCISQADEVDASLLKKLLE
jgi:hypothetical protein